MHGEILSEDQIKLIGLLGEFGNDFGLIRGTAIALQLGHRKSIDFDMLTLSDLNATEIRTVIKKNHVINDTLVDYTNELTIVVDGVKRYV